MTLRAAILLLLLATAAVAAPLPAAEDAGIRVAGEVRRAVVRVVGLTRGLPVSGTVIDPGDLVLSWSSLKLPDDLPVRIRTASGERVPGRVVRRDESSGVVAIRLESPLPDHLATFPGTLAVGAPVFSAGHPFATRRGGGLAAASLGIVSQVVRPGPGEPADRYLVSTKVNPGEFGGPLVTGGGALAGVLLPDRDRASGLSTAFPLPAVRKAFEEDRALVRALSPSEGAGEPDSPSWPVHDRLATVGRDASRAVVGVAGGAPGSGAPESVCSGLTIDADGHVLTTCANIEGIGEIRVFLADGSELPAKRLGVDERLRITLLRIESGGEVPAVSLGNGDPAQVGDFVVAVGNSSGPDRGRSPLVTMGMIGARNRSDRRYMALHTDAAVNRANEGGPLLDLEGRVVGLLSTFGGEALEGLGANSGVGFAIPAGAIRPLLPALRRGERIPYRPGYLGVTLSRDPVRGGGVLIQSVLPDLPASKAGVRPGDVIVAADNAAIDTFDMLRKTFVRFVEGQQISLVLRRGLETVTLEPVLGPWPEGGPR